MRKPRILDDFDGEVVRNRFIFGFAVTFFVVMLVPVIADILLQPSLDALFGEGGLALFSSSLVVTLILWGLVMLLKMVGSGSRVMRMMGLPGVVGLMTAYWVLGNLWGAVMPILSIVMALAWKHRHLYLDGYREC